MFPFRKTLIILVVLQVTCALIPIIPRPPVSELCAAKPPKVNTNRQKPIGNIECGEVVAYMRSLSRFYGRRCQQQGSECRDRDTYPSRWFDKVGTKITGMCQRLEMYERGEKPVGAPAWDTSDKKGDGKKCKPKNSIL
nr:uncharacterized protein LOC109397086 [Aedes albopictus]XP_029712083.1 uncharacterized protein LOC109409864 [Aedes albopictus]